jgi:hypothetical protein
VFSGAVVEVLVSLSGRGDAGALGLLLRLTSQSDGELASTCSDAILQLLGSAPRVMIRNQDLFVGFSERIGFESTTFDRRQARALIALYERQCREMDVSAERCKILDVLRAKEAEID